MIEKIKYFFAGVGSAFLAFVGIVGGIILHNYRKSNDRIKDDISRLSETGEELHNTTEELHGNNGRLEQLISEIEKTKHD